MMKSPKAKLGTVKQRPINRLPNEGFGFRLLMCARNLRSASSSSDKLRIFKSSSSERVI